ncbi:MAG: RDD family protein [Burkholderiales bacterium]|nr:RDD family protein [Burkholderiales bacterium]
MNGAGAAPASAPAATLRRRLAAMVYEALIVTAIAFLAGLSFVLAAAAVTADARVRLEGGARFALQLWVLAVLGAYFVWFWKRGQTVPMKTWKLRLVAADGGAVGTRAAVVRFAVAAALAVPALVGALELRQQPASAWAWAALLPAVAALAWCLRDPDRQSLYDRIARTRLVHAA